VAHDPVRIGAIVRLAVAGGGRRGHAQPTHHGRGDLSHLDRPSPERRWLDLDPHGAASMEEELDVWVSRPGPGGVRAHAVLVGGHDGALRVSASGAP